VNNLFIVAGADILWFFSNESVAWILKFYSPGNN